MPVTKDCISPPLEAGPSILDVHNLPAHLNAALEHASARLARKAMHVTLVVLKRDYQVPLVSPLPFITCATPTLEQQQSPPPTPASRLAFAAAPVAALKQLVRSGSQSSASSVSSGSSYSSSGGGWPLPSPAMSWPATPATPLSPPPMTPCTTASSSSSSAVTDGGAGPMTPGPFGIRLVLANALNPREEKTLRHIFDKAEKRFRVG